MKVPTTPPIFRQVRIENTNLCGYKCFFCPREKMDRKKGMQSIDDFNLALDRVDEYHQNNPFKGQIHLHGYGEPLLDKNLPEKVKIVSKRYPGNISHIVTTLGHNVSEEYLESLLKNGIRSISVSFYGSTKEIYDHSTVTGNYDLAYSNLLKVISIKKKMSNPPNISVKTSLSGIERPTDSKLEEFNKMLSDSGVKAVTFPIHNYGSGREYKSAPKKLCAALISRDVLQITWNLNVIPCCYDFNAELVYGNLRDLSVKQIFESEQMQAYLRNHCEGKADMYNPCKNCTARYMPDKPDTNK